MRNIDHQQDSNPDFDKLSDRIIADPPVSPTFVIKTTLDPKEPSENNPYAKETVKDKQKFNDFFTE